MATLRPQLIRADTLDLQDHETPSAGDHTQQPYHPDPLGAGPPAPHQEYSLRHVQEERSAEQEYLADAWGSGRSSHEGSDLLNDDHEDEARGSTEDSSLLDDSSMHLNGGEAGEAGESADKEGEDGVDDDMEDRVSSSPSIPDDEAADLREGFVWALHNFIATVEGQANATKGDVMVLLDDSNSYWWLVRVVKDSSIGYLPAEHIETAQERLARYNKHRNLEFAQAMLTDTQERSKNPLKKAMRRRNAKSVQFSTPTFYEPPAEMDWSDVEGEEDQEDERMINGATESQSTEQSTNGDEIESVTYKQNGQPSDESGLSAEIENSVDTSAEGSRTALESSRPDKESLERPETTSNKSRNGTMRNTDSFFNDDTAEPRKISLTPNLLRDESNDGVTRNSSITERASTSQDSLDQIEKSSPISDKDRLREDRKKKEKKSGMLSGLFKRKDKKIKVDEAAGGVVVKHEGESGSPVLTPGDSGSPTGRTSPTVPQSPQQSKRTVSGGKLTKSPSTSSASRQSNGAARVAFDTTPPSDLEQAGSETTETPQASDVGSESGSKHPTREEPDSSQGSRDARQPYSSRPRETSSPTAPSSSASQTRPLASKEPERITDRLNDASQGSVSSSTGQQSGILRSSDRVLQSDQNASDTSLSSTPKAFTLTSSTRFPVPDLSAPPGRKVSDDLSAPRTVGATEASSRLQHTFSETHSTHTTSSSSSAIANSPGREHAGEGWNAGALKAYLEGQSNDDAKNMLILIHNQTDITPLPLDHPTMLALGYHEQQKRLNEMSSQLDGLLHGFLARRAARPKTTQR